MQPRDQTTGWALPLLYVVCRDLRKVADRVRGLPHVLVVLGLGIVPGLIPLLSRGVRAQADEQLLANSQKPGKLEEASRLLQKCFSCCLNDRSVGKNS